MPAVRVARWGSAAGVTRALFGCDGLVGLWAGIQGVCDRQVAYCPVLVSAESFAGKVSVTSYSLLVFLRGGPSDIPEVRELESGSVEGRLKIPRWNGYEHFDLTQDFTDVGGVLMPVYQWSYRTTVAE
ncbi:DUF5988 family protein [Kitasatospora sp. NPDC017646]|uniref:DUF5988 family protein n=1 Tax=Kitasatospora sp. NPDC017646 TaxID=3364024 RepID=UPI0037B075D0